MRSGNIALLLIVGMLAGCETTRSPVQPFLGTSRGGQGSVYRPGTGIINSTDLFDAQVDSAAIRIGPSPVRSTRILAIPLFIEGAGRSLAVESSTPLFESRMDNPILAPNGHQVTLAEFRAVRGSIEVKCVEHGTRVELHLKGLIPRGVYSFWVVGFRAPGFDPFLAALTGLGTLGNKHDDDGDDDDGPGNIIRANARGEGDLAVTTRGGPASVVGSLPDCWLKDLYEFHILGAYQIDGKTYGPDLGPDGTAVEQFAFVFKQP